MEDNENESVDKCKNIGNQIQSDSYIDLKAESIPGKKENTRTFIAQLYVWAFFVVIAIVFIIGTFKDFSADEYKDLLVTVSGVLSGPLGFIVGYYFKASKD